MNCLDTMSRFVNDMIERKDIAMMAVYSLGVLSIYGLLTGTVAPDFNGGYNFTHVLIQLPANLTTVSIALALAGGTSAIAYGSDRLYELVYERDVEFSDTETLAFLAAFVVPVLHETFATVSEITTGEPALQVFFVGIGLAGYTHIARHPDEDDN